MTTIWTYYKGEEDEPEYLRDLDDGMAIMPRYAWTTREAAMAAAQEAAAECWKELRDMEDPCGLLGESPLGDAPPVLAWESDGAGLRADNDGDGFFVVYSLELKP